MTDNKQVLALHEKMLRVLQKEDLKIACMVAVSELIAVSKAAGFTEKTVKQVLDKHLSYPSHAEKWPGHGVPISDDALYLLSEQVNGLFATDAPDLATAVNACIHTVVVLNQKYGVKPQILRGIVKEFWHEIGPGQTRFPLNGI